MMFDKDLILYGISLILGIILIPIIKGDLDFFKKSDNTKIETSKVYETKLNDNYEISKQLVFSDTKKLVVELNNIMENDTIEIDNNHKLIKQIKYENNEYIFLKGNEEKIENICKSVILSFENCNLIKWKNTKNSEKLKELLKDKIKIIEIN